jgi:uncharacterized Zn-finger protein
MMSDIVDKQTASNTANQDKVLHVSPAQLPVHCPTDDMPLWNAHPRVFLEIEEQGQVSCPYCGTLFILDTPE